MKPPTLPGVEETQKDEEDDDTELSDTVELPVLEEPEEAGVDGKR